MLAEMRERYGDHIFRFSDYIMPKAYYTELLPALAAQQKKYKLHTEVKANHPPDRIRLFSKAGFKEIQPGIESFSTSVLRRMRKGVRAIDNVSLLKAGYCNRIVVHYNILFGIPGDTTLEYESMLKHVPMLYHLIPPVTCTDTAITRFAPLHTDPQLLGNDDGVVHHPWYDVVFSAEFLTKSGFSLDLYAYYFDRGIPYSEDLLILYRQLCQQVDYWKGAHRERFVELSFQVVNEEIMIVDSRYDQVERYWLSSVSSQVYCTCSAQPVKLAAIQSHLECAGHRISKSALEDAINELRVRRLIWVENDIVLGLAVPKSVSDDHERSGWTRSWISAWRH